MAAQSNSQPRRRWSLWRLLKILVFSLLAILLFILPPAFYYGWTYYHSLENEVVARMSGKRWDIPSRIFSDSTIIYPGQSMRDLGFFERLARLNYHRVEPGKVGTRGEYSYDPKRNQLVIFLHSFAYPYRQFG